MGCGLLGYEDVQSGRRRSTDREQPAPSISWRFSTPSSTLKMETTGQSKIMVSTHKITWCYGFSNQNINFSRAVNKSHLRRTCSTLLKLAIVAGKPTPLLSSSRKENRPPSWFWFLKWCTDFTLRYGNYNRSGTDHYSDEATGGRIRRSIPDREKSFLVSKTSGANPAFYSTLMRGSLPEDKVSGRDVDH